MFPRTSSALSGRIAGISASTRRAGVQGTRSRASQYTATTTSPTTTAQATNTTLPQNIPRPVYSRFTQKQTQVLSPNIIVQSRRNTKKTNTNTKNQQNNDR